jgi:hypothetical protein
LLHVATVRMRCDRCYDAKFLNISERFLADGIDLRIFCYIFVFSRRRTGRGNRAHAVNWLPDQGSNLGPAD